MESANASCWVHIEATAWEKGDSVEVWAAEGPAAGARVGANASGPSVRLARSKAKQFFRALPWTARTHSNATGRSRVTLSLR